MAPSLFVFRRDLRLEDNTGLIQAQRSSDEVLPCFIFDPAQIEENRFRGDNSVQFMAESLKELGKDLRKRGGRIYLFHGKPDEVVGRLIDDTEVSAVCLNRDYTPYSRERDRRIEAVCRKRRTAFRSYGDCLLTEPEQIKKKDGKPHTIFTHFYNKAVEQNVGSPEKNMERNFFSERMALAEDEGIYGRILAEGNKAIAVSGGRSNGLRILEKLRDYGDYGRERDFPALDATTHLSAHLKFGTVSVREAYHRIRADLGTTHPLLRQLYWRDFFTHIAYHFPKVFGESFHERFDRIKWAHDEEAFNRWRQGKTGFPIVDAGMRELNQTGYMHNRVRMITASFLTKDLHIDWRLGEKYFAQKLVDYDPSVNNGNWQWSASTGCDAQPYFRVFNPWLQQKKYDPECRYIKRWLPELREIDAKTIHNLHRLKVDAYPTPIVDHTKESAVAKAAFRSIR